MTTRRSFVRLLTCSAVALAVVGGSALAEELLGVLSKVDVEAKKVTITEKDTDKEVVVTVTDDTIFETSKGSAKIDLEKIKKGVDRAKEKGRKGIGVIVTHDKGVASKIKVEAKKKPAEPKPAEPKP